MMRRDRDRGGAEAGAELGRRLRREAARGRPEFSPALQARIMDSVSGAGRGRRRPVTAWAAAVIGCAILGVGAGLWLSGWPLATSSDRPPAAVLATSYDPPSIDELPLPDELGARLLAGTAAIAAEAVGLPRWNDLVDAGTAAFGPAGDDWPGAVSP